MSAAHKYIRNDLGSAFTFPLHVGPSLERHQVTLAKRNNAVDEEVFVKLAGRKDDTGKWRGGVASDYFNADKLVETGRPPAKDGCHVVEMAPGVIITMQSRQARERARQSAAQASMLEHQSRLLDTLARQNLDPEVVKAQAEAEKAEAEARTLKAQAEAAEARARLQSLEAPADDAEPGLDPSKHTIKELRELAQMASFSELVQAMQIEKSREGGGRQGALDAIADAMKA